LKHRLSGQVPRLTFKTAAMQRLARG
jgi:hypothetical protein